MAMKPGKHRLVKSNDGTRKVRNPSDKKIAKVYWECGGNAAKTARVLNVLHKHLQSRIRINPELKLLKLKAREQFGDPRKDSMPPQGKDPNNPTNEEILKAYEATKGRKHPAGTKLGTSANVVESRMRQQSELKPHYDARLEKNAENKATFKIIQAEIAEAKDGQISREARIALMELVKDQHFGAIKLALQSLDPSFMPKVEITHKEDNTAQIMHAIQKRYGKPKTQH